MINFENVNIQGFGSFIENINFKLDREGLNIIKGRVGAGKTTIPSAITWCIYGIGLKKKATIETWDKQRPDDYRGTKVETTFETSGNNITIIRCLNYKGKVYKIKGGNNLFIVINGELEHTQRNKQDKQLEIQKLLGYSYDLFTNSIIFGQRMKKLIEETGPKKKEIFEEAFEVTFIEEARLTAKARLDKTLSLINNFNFEKTKFEDKIADLKIDIEEAKEFEMEFRSNKRKRIRKFRAKIKEYQLDKLKVVQQLDTSKVVDTKALKIKGEALKKNLKQVTDNNQALKDLVIEIVELETEETELYNQHGSPIKICKECGGTLTFKKSKLLTRKRDKRLEELKLVIDIKRDKQFKSEVIDEKPIEKLINDNNKAIEQSKIDAALLSSRRESIRGIDKRILGLSSEIKEVKSEVLKNRSKKYAETLVINEEKLIKVNIEIDSLKEFKDIDNWLINDPLSNNGLKAYVFDSLLGRVNKYLNDYSIILGFRVEFGIDIESSRKDFYQTITRGDNLIMYEDLSGGQKQLVDTSVALALHSVISSLRPMNLIFMDEPFEGLDDETVETVAELIDFKCKDQCLYLITHHNAFNPINAKNISIKLGSEGNSIVS